MKNIKVVIGSGFGDEGKGLMTDFFCNNFEDNEKVLNVRFNGSSQAGHTVVTPSGQRHIFSQFGAGSFNKNVVTYLSSYFIVNPINLNIEYDVLAQDHSFPFNIFINRESRVLLPFDSLINVFLETARGSDRHGSCGAGVFEAVLRSGTPDCDINIIDLFEDDEILFHRIKNLRDSYYKYRIKYLELELSEEEKDIFYSDNLINHFIVDCKKMLEYAIVSYDESILNYFDNQVYEGAQGLLLSWDNEDYAPNLTASFTGMKNVVSLLDIIEECCEVEICYVTRSYSTRHGAGKFNTEVINKEVLSKKINEKTNITNPWQEHFRYGYIDSNLFFRSILYDLLFVADSKNNFKISLAITHLDETDGKILFNQRFIPINKFAVPDLKLYGSYGETRETIFELGDN